MDDGRESNGRAADVLAEVLGALPIVKFQSHWRKQAAEVISGVLDMCGPLTTPEDEKAARLRLREAYPFGAKKYYPYKVWLDEIARQLGKKWPIGHKRAWENNQKRMKTQRQKLQEWNELYGKQA